MRNYLTYLIAIVMLFGIICRVDGQTITFNKVLPPSGKTFKHITGIVQDVNGYMWFSSKHGIFRFDGYQMINYKNNPLDPNSLASNQLDAICTDSTGNIWVATLDAGLDKLDPATGIFKHYRHDPKDPGSIHSDYTCALLMDHEGILWVATNKGLDRFDSQKNQFNHFSHIPDDSTSISSNQVRAIYEDREGTLWIGTGSAYLADEESPEEGGLNRFDRKTGTFTRYLHDPKNPHTLINNKVQSLFVKVLISVKDNGNGIPPNLMDKIFQPFFTTKPTGQGTGLGLSMSYDIVKAHGGELKVETREGEGSEFTIQLLNSK